MKINKKKLLIIITIIVIFLNIGIFHIDSMEGQFQQDMLRLIQSELLAVGELTELDATLTLISNPNIIKAPFSNNTEFLWKNAEIAYGAFNKHRSQSNYWNNQVNLVREELAKTHKYKQLLIFAQFIFLLSIPVIEFGLVKEK